jgi:hypothetical protein
MKAYYVAMNIYRSSSYPTLEASAYRSIYNILLLNYSSDICARDHSITEFTPTHNSLKKENNGILLFNTKISSYSKIQATPYLIALHLRALNAS